MQAAGAILDDISIACEWQEREGWGKRVGHVIHVLSCSKELTLVQSNTNTAECMEGSSALARSVDDAACDVRDKGSSDGQCSRR